MAFLTELSQRLLPGEAGPVCDAATLAWRYRGPVYDDHVFWGIAAGSARALVVTRRDDDTEVMVDVFAPPAHLVVVLRAVAATSSTSCLLADLHGSRPASAFAAAGWLVRPQNAHFVVLAEDRDLQERLASGPWAFFGGESDLDLRRHPRLPDGREEQ